MDPKILEYYSRKDIQKKIMEASRDREVGVKYGEGGFGKRPDIIQFENDVQELAKGGATSFHVSEERWSNPLLLESGMTKIKLDDIRCGWDCIIDLDTKFVEYAKIAADLVIRALQFHDVKNIGLKFSGGNGFHIGIPFEAFPSNVDGQNIKFLFPEGVRVIAEYLKNMIEEPLREKILEVSEVEDISKSIDKPVEELMKNDAFDPFSVVEIDSVLISNRHMYRAPYSVNEKKRLVSIPIKLSELKDFNLEKAKIENVKVGEDFLPKKIDGLEANQLIMQAFDALKKKSILVEEEVKSSGRKFELPKLAVKIKYWAPCIKKGLLGMGDGKKRFLFILINYLRSLGWDFEGISKVVSEWNKKNKQPLKEGYIMSQLNWHKSQREKKMPPNCSNKSYYGDLGIECPDSLCNVIKNPVNYSLRRLRMIKENRKKPRKKRVKK